MLFHLSIEADRPQRVARVLAEIWGGEAMPFPAVTGAWVVFADDGKGTIVEVYPRGTVMMEAPGTMDAVAVAVAQPTRRHSATHFAMSTKLSIERIHAIAERERWSTKYCRRAGRFGVIELWIEGGTLVEVLTPEMQAEYVDFVTPENWRSMLKVAGPNQIAA